MKKKVKIVRIDDVHHTLLKKYAVENRISLEKAGELAVELLIKIQNDTKKAEQQKKS